MEGIKFNKNGVFLKPSKLLELAAADDVSGFKSEVEDQKIGLDEVGLWYGRKNGSKSNMGFQERTPLMIASTYGSLQIIQYLKHADVNKISGSDGATALHCAAAGGSPASVEAVKLLLDAGADANLPDSNGNNPGDLIPRARKSSTRKALEMMLKGFTIEEKETVLAKKEYPINVSLPDINTGVYGSDEFRMYTFKVQPCSRAYSHDWTECPFVHPGENARRRDLRKHGYSCVPCPEFRKGSCAKGDACEYAHGVFESWLHPAQYKTRLCKDENGCARKVCFFAHKVEELRPVFAATGSGVSSMEMGSPPASPTTGNLGQNKGSHLTPPPALQLPGSRLKTAVNARDLEIGIELLQLENIRTQQNQQFVDDLSSNLYTRFGELKGSNLDDVLGLNYSPRLLSSMSTTPTQLQSPTRVQNSSPIRASYPSPVRKPSFGFDSSAAVAQAMMNSRSGGFAKQRSLSFVDHGVSLKPKPKPQSLNLSEWGSPDGKLDWGFNGEDASKLRKSMSFGFRNGNGGSPVGVGHEPDDSWVGAGLYSSSEKVWYGGGREVPQWVEQMYIEQEQLVA